MPLDRSLLEKIAKGLSTPDPKAEIQRDRKGEIIYDADLKDTEIVPYKETIDDYMTREVLPHLPGAKAFFLEDLTAKKPVIKTGAEFPFVRHFYKYTTIERSDTILKELARLNAEFSKDPKLPSELIYSGKSSLPTELIVSTINNISRRLDCWLRFSTASSANMIEIEGTIKRLDEATSLCKKLIDRTEALKRSMTFETLTGKVYCDGEPLGSLKLSTSTIPWIESLPQGWTVKKLGEIYSNRSVKVSDNDRAPLSVTMHGVVPQLSSVAKTKNGEGRKLVLAGDFVINSRSDRRGACGVATQCGSVSTVNIVLKPVICMCGAYFDSIFHTDGFADEFYKWGKGIDSDVWSTRWAMMKKISIPVPPIEEQRSIAVRVAATHAVVDALTGRLISQHKQIESIRRLLVYEHVTGKKECLP